MNNTLFWVEEEGNGPAVLFLHGGLGDWRLFEPQLRALADEFRCIAYDRRFTGRTEAPGEPFSSIGDAIALLDALEVDRAALVGLSAGGGLALDVAYAHPERAWALAHIAAGVSGMPVDAYTPEQYAREDEMEVDFEVWAPLGADELMRELWRQTPDALGMPAGAAPAPRPDVVLEHVRVPTLVIAAKHDPPAQQAVGRVAAERIPGARLVEIDSDHYLTLREPELVTKLLRDFFAETIGAH